MSQITGCLGRIILPKVCFDSFHLSSGRSILPKVSFRVFSFVSQMIALLDALAGSFCQGFLSFLYHLSPTWLLCWMPWPGHFATGLFSFLFIGPAHDCFAGCLGRIILPKVSFHVCSCVSHLVHCWMAWPDPRVSLISRHWSPR